MDRNKIFSAWLSSINGVGAKTFKKLVDYFGNAETVYKSNADDIKQLVNNERILNSIIEAKKVDPYKYAERLNKEKIKVLLIDDDEYPKLLREIYDAPPVLYVKGNITESDDMSIAIVGSRNATSYGKLMSEKFSYELSKHGFTIISGMARGIDSQAHKGAIKAGGRTIAVLGCGVNIAYPEENKKLMEEIISKGAVVSEYPLDYLPVAGNFPARNRIISGLSLGVLVVEAGVKSGSLITAKFALEQGRDVFAVPGIITSAYSKGTNGLIKQGAKLVANVSDILDEYNFREDIKTRINERFVNTLSSEERKLYAIISECPRDIEEIVEITKFPISKVNYLLSSLTIKGLIVRLAGNKYEKSFN
ncbi:MULTISPECIES: DNA-processing protein DprA [Thermoanaerobacterium]|uniref:DNA protecting protein DprA n=2 Tax=Thermoanaerobacterium TaxID=28895 RepID=W9E9H4_9THEO|nr:MULTISPECIES: DNA-processing protein DprA [Thermoanaerobacterium]AFK86779.1 DNA protecting protein DprA [Thermoanaerobacterium saccharolyticum JW/SL-YS485]ETO38603.1 DNA protecting protein DprA [Thermoanaerobacterium aotearoense SCUT27]